MAEISRVKQKIFAKNAVATDLGVVGSKSTGTPDYSTDVATLQSLAQFETGLRAMVTPTDAPYLQDQNSLFYIITSQLAYLFQAGVPAWEAATEYFAYKSLVTYNGKIYVAVQNSTNQNPSTEASYWLEYNELFIKYLPTTYNADVATAIGGYPIDAVLDYFDGNNVIKIISLVENNTNEPNGVNIKYANSGAGTYYWQCATLDTGLRNLSDGLERTICDTPVTTTSTASSKRPAVIVKNYYDRTTEDWYRIWSDGWCEQGGRKFTNGAYNWSDTINFLVSFAEIRYTITSALDGASSGYSVSFTGGTKTSITVYSTGWSSISGSPFYSVYWRAAGYCTGQVMEKIFEQTSIGNGASIVNEQYTKTFTEDTVLSIELGGGYCSRYNLGGGELKSTIQVQNGDTIKAVSINGREYQAPSAVGILLNNTPILYAGAAAGDTRGLCGGAGYEGGRYDQNANLNGYSYDGSVGNWNVNWSSWATDGTACGAVYHDSTYTARGGNGYIASAYSSDTAFRNGTNGLGAYIKIYQYL